MVVRNEVGGRRSLLSKHKGGQQTKSCEKTDKGILDSDHVFLLAEKSPGSLGNPDDVNHNHRQDAERTYGETSASPRAKRQQRNHACERTDDEQYGGNIDSPVPDVADIEAFVKVAKLSQKSATLFFHLTSSINPVDRHDRASARNGEGHLDLVGVVVIVRGSRADS